MFGFLRKKKPETAKPVQADIPPSPPVVPLVVTLARIAAYRQQVESDCPAGPQRDLRMPVVHPLTGDLCIAYTSDLAELSKLVSEGDLASRGVDRDGLHALSLRDLRRHVQGRLTINQSQDLFLIAGLRGLEASLMAVPEVWNGIGSQFGGEVIVAVPFGGIVIAYVEPAANAPRDRKAAGRRAKERFLAEARAALRTANADPLSSHAFAWREETWLSLGSIEPARPAVDSLATTYRCAGCGSGQFVTSGGVFDEESLKCVGCGAVVTSAQVAEDIARETGWLGAERVSVEVVRTGPPA